MRVAASGLLACTEGLIKIIFFQWVQNLRIPRYVLFCSDERAALNEEARRAARDADSITDVMRADIMHLLDLFGFPYLV